MIKQEKTSIVAFSTYVSTGKNLNLLLPDPATLTEEEVDDIKEFLQLVMTKLDRQNERNKKSDI
jgi:hypothetical protein